MEVIDVDTYQMKGEIIDVDNYQSRDYLQLLEFENSGNCVPNILEFDCPVCFLQIPPGQGIILRDCFHHFCKNCLESTILNCTEVQIKCPFIDDNYNCGSMLQEREIRGILTEENFNKHLMKSLRQAEQKIQNTFHCKQPDCDWFCVVDPGITEIKCEICKIEYCMKCQVSFFLSKFSTITRIK
jgi:RanBP-type and C3HC4-type zinc finger-containing protein 1